MPTIRQIVLEVVGKDKASAALGKVSGALKGIGAAAAVGVGAAVAVGGALTKLAIDAAPLEGVRKAFEGIATASGKSADDMLAALKKGSSGMVAQADLMKSYNSAAQLVSKTFANQLPDAMSYLSKVSAATGEDMGYMLDSLVKGVGRLSPMILDNLGIQVDLTAANEEYAKSLGVSTAELTKEQQQAALMNQVMAKLAENTASMPGVAGTAAQSIGALKAQFADIKAEIGTAFLPVLQSLLATFQQVWAASGPEIMERIAAAAKDFAAWLTPERLTQIADSIIGVVDAVLGLVDAFMSMPPWAQKALIGGGLAMGPGGGAKALGGLAMKGAGKALGLGGGAAAAGGAGAAGAGGAGAAAGAAGGLSALGVGAAVVGGAGLGLAGYEGLRRAGLAQENSASAQQIVAVAAHGLGKLFGGQELGQKWFSSVSGIQPGGGGQQVQVVVGIDPENGNVTAYTDQRIEQSNYQVAEELSGGNYRQEYGNR